MNGQERDWKSLYEQEHAIVDRIWDQLGRPSYEQLNGRSLFDLIEELKARSEAQFRDWLRTLDDDVIQGEFGFEEGEFDIFPDDWRPLYEEGLTPRQAYQRALDAAKTARSR